MDLCDMTRSEFQVAESKAQAKEAVIPTAKTAQEVLEATIDAAESYLHAVRLVSCKEDEVRADDKCKALLNRAELIKEELASSSPVNAFKKRQSYTKLGVRHPISRRSLTTREEIILLESSRLNGAKFLPWPSDPNHDEYDWHPGDEPFTDTVSLSLPTLHLSTFGGWRRPPEALGRLKTSLDGSLQETRPTMQPTNPVDLVQDVTPDCSVVASLCAESARSARGHQTVRTHCSFRRRLTWLQLLHCISFPHDPDAPPSFQISPSSRYMIRFYFNGCQRRVIIDDLLPTSTDSRLFHVVDRGNPGYLLPALIEKAYLKLRGGYDFPGSNSGTDLAVMTGWIPEQIFLYDNETFPDDLWRRVYTAFSYGDVLMTVGTGKLSEEERRHNGLLKEHDYAVLDVRELDGTKQFLLKDPWCRGNACGTASRASDSSHIHQEIATQQGKKSRPGTFWTKLDTVFQNFENVYLNWNPSLFLYRQDYHFSWDLSNLSLPTSPINSFEANPQFVVRCALAGPVWLLLSRHYRADDYSSQHGLPHGYISMYLFDSQGKRILLSDGAMLRGPFVDSPNVLLKFEATSNMSYTIVPSGQDLPCTKVNFTLSVLSLSSVELSPATDRYRGTVSQQGAWRPNTAGGNVNSANYSNNPQYLLRLTEKAEVAIMLASQHPQARAAHAIHIKVFAIGGSRLTSPRARDVVAHSGDYRQRNALIETTLEKGDYTIVCSTFELGQVGNFQISARVSSLSPPTLTALPDDTSGRLMNCSSPAIFSAGINRLRARLSCPRLTRATLVMHDELPPKTQVAYHSPLKLTIEQGQGPYKTCLAKSVGTKDTDFEYSSSPRIENFDIRADLQKIERGGLWVILERPAGIVDPLQAEERFQVTVWAEERVEIGAWGHCEG